MSAQEQLGETQGVMIAIREIDTARNQAFAEAHHRREVCERAFEVASHGQAGRMGEGHFSGHPRHFAQTKPVTLDEERQAFLKERLPKREENIFGGKNAVVLYLTEGEDTFTLATFTRFGHINLEGIGVPEDRLVGYLEDIINAIEASPDK